MLTTYLDGQIFGRKSGDGPPPILLMHGWGRTSSDFAPVLANLDGLAIDLPGFGSSPAPANVWGAREYADFIAPILNDCASQVTLVGHSFGGRIAAVLAARHPGTVKDVVLIGAPVVEDIGRERPKIPGKYRIAKRLHKMGFVSDHALEQKKNQHGSTDYRAAEGVMRSILVRLVNETYEHELKEIKAPVHLLWGNDDLHVPLTVASRAKELIPDATLHIMHGAGHDLSSQVLDELSKLLRENPA